MKAAYSFTKLVVGDLEAMAGFYRDVYGLTELQRVQSEIDGAPMDEIILGVDGEHGGLILLSWIGQAAETGEVILGFTTPDIAALFDRVEAAGGMVREAPKARPEAGGLTVGFVTDPEGHLSEVVEMNGS
jgi:lactoylglutathione lyase